MNRYKFGCVNLWAMVLDVRLKSALRVYSHQFAGVLALFPAFDPHEVETDEQVLKMFEEVNLRAATMHKISGARPLLVGVSYNQNDMEIANFHAGCPWKGTMSTGFAHDIGNMTEEEVMRLIGSNPNFIVSMARDIFHQKGLGILFMVTTKSFDDAIELIMGLSAISYTLRMNNIQSFFIGIDGDINTKVAGAVHLDIAIDSDNDTDGSASAEKPPKGKPEITSTDIMYW